MAAVVTHSWALNFLSLLVIIAVIHQCLSLSSTERSSSDTLELVQVFFRHGSRNPIRSYPTSPYQESDFPGGWGQLTEAGLVQMYGLGQYLRKRYGMFLSPQYSQYEAYMLSSDKDRTILSGLGVASGIYSHFSQNDSTIRQWTPFPIRTIPREDDNLIGYSKVCEKYEKLLKEFMETSETVRNLDNENADLLDYVNQYSLLNLTRYDKPFVDFHDGLVIQQEVYNLPLPNWTLPFYNTEEVLDIVETILGFRTATPELQRLRVGPLLKLIRMNMESKISANILNQPPLMEDSRRKMILFSGHDYTLIQLMMTLGIYKFVDKRPAYASAFTIELHRNSSNSETFGNRHFIRFFYLNNTNDGPFELSIPGYETPISFQGFLEATDPFIPLQDWNLECSITELQTEQTPQQSLRYVFGLGICLLILATAVLTTVILPTRLNSPKDYVQL